MEKRFARLLPAGIRDIAAYDSLSAQSALAKMHAGTAVLWRGDYHQGKALLAAVKKQVRRKSKSVPGNFHQHRMRQAQQSRLFRMLLVEIGPGFVLCNGRAPDIRFALKSALGAENETAFLLPLHMLLGYIGAAEWYKRGVEVPALGGRHIHVPFGVFAPVRGEYVDLVAAASLPEPCMTAADIGTGSGVLAAVLASRGIPSVMATDNNPRAVTCAQENIARLGLGGQVRVSEMTGFPEGFFDLIVCNPPWLPAKPVSDIEAAQYDEHHKMLKDFLRESVRHLNPGGSVWLVMSDLAEHLGLREKGMLEKWIEESGLRRIARSDVRPRHAKAGDSGDPLHKARVREVTSLWQLAV